MAIFDMHASDWVLRMPKVFRSSIDSWTGAEPQHGAGAGAGARARDS